MPVTRKDLETAVARLNTLIGTTDTYYLDVASDVQGKRYLLKAAYPETPFWFFGVSSPLPAKDMYLYILGSIHGIRALRHQLQSKQDALLPDIHKEEVPSTNPNYLFTLGIHEGLRQAIGDY